MALAQAWKRRGGEVHFATACKNPVILKTMLDEGFGRLPLEETPPQGNRLEEGIRSFWSSSECDRSWVVLDGYPFGWEYQKAVKESNKQLLVVDDYAHLPRYEADVLLNHNLEAEKLEYKANKECVFLLGPRYALLRREFLEAKQATETPDSAKRLLVTLGGSDPEGVTFRILEGLSRVKGPEMEVKILVGPANPRLEEVKGAAAASGLRCEIVETSTKMPVLMAWADLAITAGGGTCMELAFMGVPFLVIALAENQKQVMSGFANKAAAVALGWHADLEPTRIAAELHALAKDRSRREGFSRLGQALVDGLGAPRVTEVMDPTRVTLRRVQEGDREILWHWANEPRTRTVSFSSNPIPWEDHRQWFAEKLHSEKCLFYVATNQHGVPLGQARFDLEENGAVISASLDHDFRSLGLGSKLIRAASEQAVKERNLARMEALIKRENVASLRAFSKAGFEFTAEERVQGCAAFRMVYRGQRKE